MSTTDKGKRSRKHLTYSVKTANSCVDTHPGTNLVCRTGDTYEERCQAILLN